MNKCSKCRLDIIEEEYSTHVCFSGIIKDAILDSSQPHSFLVFDGHKWHKCPIPKNNRRVTRRRNNRQGNSTLKLHHSKNFKSFVFEYF